MLLFLCKCIDEILCKFSYGIFLFKPLFTKKYQMYNIDFFKSFHQ